MSITREELAKSLQICRQALDTYIGQGVIARPDLEEEYVQVVEKVCVRGVWSDAAHKRTVKEFQQYRDRSIIKEDEMIQKDILKEYNVSDAFIRTRINKGSFPESKRTYARTKVYDRKKVSDWFKEYEKRKAKEAREKELRVSFALTINEIIKKYDVELKKIEYDKTKQNLKFRFPEPIIKSKEGLLYTNESIEKWAKNNQVKERVVCKESKQFAKEFKKPKGMDSVNQALNMTLKA